MKRVAAIIFISLLLPFIGAAQDLSGDIEPLLESVEESVIEETVAQEEREKQEPSGIVELTFKEEVGYLKRTILIARFKGDRRSYQDSFRSILASKLEDSGSFKTIVAKKEDHNLDGSGGQPVPDILVTGELTEVGGNLTFRVVVTDRLFDRNIIKERYSLGDDVISGIDRITINLTRQLFEYYSVYRKELISRISALSHSSQKDKRLMAEQLLSQKNAFLDYSMSSSKQKKVLPLIFNQSALIFAAEEETTYTVFYGEEQFRSKDGIVVLSFPDDKREDRQFIIKKEGESDILFNYRPKERFQVLVENLIFFNSKIIDQSRFYLDFNFIVTTKFSIGADMKFGIGLLKEGKLENNLYGRMQFNYRPVDKFAYFRLKFGAGYQHIFFIKNIIGFMPGIEIGFEFYLLKAVQVLNTIFHFDGKYLFGMPTLYISFPLLWEFPSNLKYSLIFGVEPIFRIIPKMMYYDGFAWLEDYYINFIYPSYMRVTIPVDGNDSAMALDLFFYDMPIILGVRVKI